MQQCIPFLTQECEPCNIWNLDETGLFWRGLLQKSLVLKGEEAKGTRLAKERLTICLLCAANDEKFQPLVIGKAAKPRAFNDKMPNDIIWRSNTKAWMTANIFKEYIQIWNKEMI